MALFKKDKSPVKYSAPIGPEMNFVSNEAFNTIRTNLRFSKIKENCAEVIAITSATPHDGKSYVAINTAYALAKSGLKVLLIDADLRKPTIAKKLNLRTSIGLTELILDMAKVKDVTIKNIFNESLDLIVSGTIPPNPSELLGSDQMKKIIKDLSLKYDYIILDMPPVESVIDTISLSEVLDGAVMVVRHKLTRKSTLRESMRQLDFASIKVLGFVYNAYELENRRYYNSYKYNYNYRYYYKNYK